MYQALPPVVDADATFDPVLLPNTNRDMTNLIAETATYAPLSMGEYLAFSA